MSTALLISPEEYMARSFEHDVEYVDGRLVERSVPTYHHSRLQNCLATYFTNHEGEWKLRSVTEQRVQVRPGIFRIPDVCLIRTHPEKGYVTEPPVLVVEILSPDEDPIELLQKIGEYKQMGVETIWIIDPVRRTGTVFTGGSSFTVKDSIFRAGVVEVNLNELALD